MPYVKVKPLECPECGRKFQSKQTLQFHWINKHTTAFQDAERVIDEHLSKNNVGTGEKEITMEDLEEWATR